MFKKEEITLQLEIVLALLIDLILLQILLLIAEFIAHFIENSSPIADLPILTFRSVYCLCE